jgi:hypothetical protein
MITLLPVYIVELLVLIFPLMQDVIKALAKENQKTEDSREWPPGARCKRKPHIRRADEEHISSERARQAEAGADMRDVAPQE